MRGDMQHAGMNGLSSGRIRTIGRWDSPIVEYVIAAAAVVVVTVIRWLLDPALGDHLPYVTYFVAVAFVAWWSGLGPSVFALVGSWWAAGFFFMAPRYIWYPHVNTVTHLVGTATYFIVGLSNIAVCEAMRRAQARAEQEREFFRVMVASIGDAVITTDKNGRVIRQNVVASELTGWGEDEVLGRPLEEIFRIINEETRKPAQNPVSKVLAEGKVVGLANHTVLIAKDGWERAIDDSAAPIRDSDGKVLGVVLVFRDVTERRRLDQDLQDSEARKSAILNTALDCIITIDHEGKILEFNPAAERTFGYDRGTAIGRQMVDLIVPPALREKHRGGFARYLATGEARVLNRRLELTAVGSDGKEFAVELAITRIPGKGPPVFTGYLRDITDRKRSEERQRLLTNELNHRVKNILAVVQSLVMRTLSDHDATAEARDVLLERVQALGRVQELLMRTHWRGAPIKDIAAAELEPFGERIRMSGPALIVDGRMVQTFALVLHELATNAAKYGSLSNEKGTVSITWSVSGEGADARFKFRWEERDGPTLESPSRKGFGSTLLETAITSDLSIKPRLSFEPGGFVYELEAPLGAIAQMPDGPLWPSE